MNKDILLVYPVAFLVILIIAKIIAFCLTKNDVQEMKANAGLKKQRIENIPKKEMQDTKRNKNWIDQINHGSYDKFLISRIAKHSNFLKRNSYKIPFKEGV